MRSWASESCAGAGTGEHRKHGQALTSNFYHIVLDSASKARKKTRRRELNSDTELESSEPLPRKRIRGTEKFLKRRASITSSSSDGSVEAAIEPETPFNISNLDSNKGPLTFIIPEGQGRVGERVLAFDEAEEVGKASGKFFFIN